MATDRPTMRRGVLIAAIVAVVLLLLVVVALFGSCQESERGERMTAPAPDQTGAPGVLP